MPTTSLDKDYTRAILIMILTILITGALSWSAWVTLSILALRNDRIQIEHKIEIIDSKLDMLLLKEGIRYNGPPLEPKPFQSQPQDR